MQPDESSSELLRLFDDLLGTMKRLKRVKIESTPTTLIFEINEMTENSKSKIFSESSSWINPNLKEGFLEHGLVQTIASEDGEKYALTLSGIAKCIQIRYGENLEKQFLDFLALADKKRNTTDLTTFLWNEKLASLSLILLACTSESAAVRLDNEQNKTMLAEVFRRVLDTMKDFGLANREEDLPTVSRGETPVSALMSRLDTLPRKSNQYYRIIGKGSAYYFDLEKDGSIDDKRLFFLLRRVFVRYDAGCNYSKMYSEFSKTSQSYYPKFLARIVRTNVVLDLLSLLREFMDNEILHLPSKESK